MASVVDHNNHTEGAPTHGEGSQLGWSGRARAQRAGGDVGCASRVSCARAAAGRDREGGGVLATLPGPTRVAYEAGPTGYGLARALHAAGIGCVVAAPGKIERPAQDQIKTDQRDAERVLRLLMIDALHPVRVPSVEEEALRDLVRAREDLRGDLMRARQRLSQAAAAPRHPLRGHARARGRSATAPGCARRTSAAARRRRCSTTSARSTRSSCAATRSRRRSPSSCPARRGRRPVARLRCLRGIDTLSAVGLCAEIGDFAASSAPGQLMSYLGLVPSENSSGETRRQGAITKTGSRHARRLLVEAAWHYRKTPARGITLQRRQDGQPANIVAISWQAQQRLHRVWRRLDRAARQAPHDRRRRRRPRTRRLLLGTRQRRLTRPTAHATSVEEAAEPGHTRESIRDLTMSSRTPGHARSLDSGLSRRNPVLRRSTDPRIRV